MAGYPVIGASALCTHDPQGVDILNVDGSYDHYNVGDTVPLAKLISRRYSWLVNRGYVSETEVGFGGGGGAGTWGSITGTLSSQTDLQTALNGKLNITGGTLTGDLVISKANAVFQVDSTSGDSSLYVDTTAAQSAKIYFRTGTSKRWSVGKNNVSESGANAGSNLVVQSYDDSGVLLDTPVSIARSTGDISLSSSVSVADNLTVSGYIDLESAQLDSDLKSISVTTPFLLDAFSATLYRTAEYTVQLSQGTNFAVCKLLLIHNGTDVGITEYGFAEIGTSIPFVFSTNYSLGDLELLVTCSNANATTVEAKFSRLLYDA